MNVEENALFSPAQREDLLRRMRLGACCFLHVVMLFPAIAFGREQKPN
jgi:hypothetical protein